MAVKVSQVFSSSSLAPKNGLIFTISVNAAASSKKKSYQNHNQCLYPLHGENFGVAPSTVLRERYTWQTQLKFRIRYFSWWQLRLKTTLLLNYNIFLRLSGWSCAFWPGPGSLLLPLLWRNDQGQNHCILVLILNNLAVKLHLTFHSDFDGNNQGS